MDNANQRETEKLKTQLTKAEKGNETLRDELNHTRIKLKHQIEEMNNLDEKYDDLEQYSRKNSLEILGVPKGAYTSTDEVFIRIGKAINVDIKSIATTSMSVFRTLTVRPWLFVAIQLY